MNHRMMLLLFMGTVWLGCQLPVAAKSAADAVREDRQDAEAAAAVPATPSVRILKLKDIVICKNTDITLRDLLTNPTVLTAREADEVLMKTPTDQDINLSIVDIAYLLQRHPTLLSAKLRGARTICLRHLNDMRFVDQAKKQLLQYLRANAPWKEWEVDVEFTPADETLVNRVGEFKRIEVLPYDNNSMIGVVAFRISFFDDHDRLLSKVNVNPVVLRKMSAMVMKENRTIGHIVQRSDLKQIPVWIGGEKKGYITEENECIGKELAKDVPAGELLRKPDLLNPVCAQRGQVIWVTCNSGALTVKLAVQAMETGRLGDVIKVQNRSTEKEFSVELIGPKQAVHRLGT